MRKIASHESLRGCGAKAYDKLRLNGRQFCFEPRLAGGDFNPARLGMNTALAALDLELEMLYSVGDIDLLAIKLRFMHCFVEQPPCRTNERVTFDIFFIAWLLSHHDDFLNPEVLRQIRPGLRAHKVRNPCSWGQQRAIARARAFAAPRELPMFSDLMPFV